MGIQQAWQALITGYGVSVAVIDNGVYPNHPSIWPNYQHDASKDFVDNDIDSTPIEGNKLNNK